MTFWKSGWHKNGMVGQQSPIQHNLANDMANEIPMYSLKSTNATLLDNFDSEFFIRCMSYI